FKYLRNFTSYSLPFDFVFGIVAIGLAFPLRFIVNVLTAPDVAPRERKVSYNRRVLDEIGSK
ncbi:MAG: hypothetical protein K8F91_17835, partial [Candidatus Obscuribacterales bacterium]|nr:hypothetical protein [Candidatus Obscuribacterales bacterium]